MTDQDLRPGLQVRRGRRRLTVLGPAPTLPGRPQGWWCRDRDEKDHAYTADQLTPLPRRKGTPQ